MTATLAVLLIITLLAMIFLPFGRSLMKDRAELHEIADAVHRTSCRSMDCNSSGTKVRICSVFTF